MKFFQISDLHIPNTNEETYGIDVIQNFKRILNHINSQEFDALFITGDIAYKQANDVSYSFVKDALNQIQKPVYILSGNHDDSIVLKSYFPLNYPTKSPYYSIQIQGTKVICLDSSFSIIYDLQLEWFVKEIQNLDQVYLFVHHPILQTDVVFMESKHALQNRDEICKVLYEYGKPVHVFCGHFHIERYQHNKNISQYITPAVFYQIRPDVLHFEIGSKDIGYREIDITNNVVNTRVIWL